MTKHGIIDTKDLGRAGREDLLRIIDELQKECERHIVEKAAIAGPQSEAIRRAAAQILNHLPLDACDRISRSSSQPATVARDEAIRVLEALEQDYRRHE